ncbi:MAG: hypothetical protein EOO96_17995, partial [Pedobacter sp.]
MGNFFTATSILIFLGCLLLGGLYAWLLYGTNKNLNAILKNALAAFRVVVIALIAYLLFAPLVKRISYNPENYFIISD